MKFVLLAAGGLAIGAIAAGGGVYLVTQRPPAPDAAQAALSAPITDSMVIGTGSVTGGYFPAGGAVCVMVNQTRAEHGIHCSVESTAGSSFNLTGVMGGALAMGVVQSDWQYHAYQGTAPLAGGRRLEALRAVFSLYAEPLSVVTRAQDRIDTFKDLRGKRFNPGVQGTSQRASVDALFAALGWESDDYVEVPEVTPGEEVAALCSGTVDAILITSGHPNGVVAQLASGCEAKLVPIDPVVLEEVVATTPYFTTAVIPGGLYPGNVDDVASFGLGATIVTGAQVPEETVYQVVRAVFENLEAFAAQHPVLSTLSPAKMVNSLSTAPLHPGAERYFRERGLI
ncbi:MAG: TAXI family TRAP transporter solute-binding subunit [Alphaproteobacteria bacterium]